MRATLKMVEERYGGAEAYVRDRLGLSEADIKLVRQNLVEDNYL